MTRVQPRLQRGRSWLELAVIACATGAIAWFWLAGLHELQATSEKTILDLTLRNMRTGLQLRMGELMLANQTHEIPKLAGQNPVQWLARPPEGYLGERDVPPQAPPPGSWYFDRSTRTLRYFPAALQSDPLAWRIVPATANRGGGVPGVRLAPLP